ncbi:MAG: mechanosensitive ion channel domain-containing protein [Anaerolineae bacterium]|jgi:small-conductance mechanosensitive channel
MQPSWTDSTTRSRIGRLRWPLCALLLLLFLTWLAVSPAPSLAQDIPVSTPTPTGDEQPVEAPDSVDVQPQARDEEIRMRLQGILEATGWFVNPQVRVDEGVVFLNGGAENAEFKTWAGDLARRTTDVTAVVNQMEVLEPSVWDFEPVLTGLEAQGRSVLRAVPLIVFGLFVLVLSWLVARILANAARESLRRRQWSPLLVTVGARGVGLVILLVGLYIIFQVAGLTSVAFTVLGTTGLLGLILGIAFQDITENFLASIFLSIQTPFEAGDLVDIDGTMGFVQRLTTRATILMTQDGNHVQIPNATVYKSNIHNYTSNPNRREDFVIGIGYSDSVAGAQEVALQVLEDHPAVLDDPEPWVLVESLGAAAVNLRIYFWIDGSQYSWQKVRSSVIRLVKRAYQSAGIEMPGEVRELVLPERIPIELHRPDGVRREAAPAKPSVEEPDTVSTQAEAGLHSEAEDIEEQARRSRVPEEGEDLLRPTED